MLNTVIREGIANLFQLSAGLNHCLNHREDLAEKYEPQLIKLQKMSENFLDYLNTHFPLSDAVIQNSREITSQNTSLQQTADGAEAGQGVSINVLQQKIERYDHFLQWAKTYQKENDQTRVMLSCLNKLQEIKTKKENNEGGTELNAAYQTVLKLMEPTIALLTQQIMAEMDGLVAQAGSLNPYAEATTSPASNFHSN